MTKDECKDKIAEQEGYGDWADLWGAMQQKFHGIKLFAIMNTLENRVMDEYAQQQIKNLNIPDVMPTVCDCRADQWCVNCYEIKKPMILGNVIQTEA